MKKKIAWILAGFWLVVGLFCCVILFSLHSHRPRHNDQTKIVVSGYVPYALVRAIAGDTVALEMVLPPGAEPHSFEPTPGVLVALKQADGFIYISDGLEPWAADLQQNAVSNVRTLRLADSVPAARDPHIWMDLRLVPIFAEKIKDFLSTLYPQKSLVYAKNLAKFNKEISALQADFMRDLSRCRYKEVVHIGHLAFGNLVRPYGLTLTALSGTSHDGEHSVRKLISLTRKIKQQQLPAIFTEETLSNRLPKAVASETGVEILPLYSIEHISKDDFEKQVSYVELMRRNLDNLKRGLQCPAS